MLLTSCPIFASNSIFMFCDVVIANSVFFAVSSHHSTYSWYAFASATPSAVIFAIKSSINCSAVLKGLLRDSPAHTARQTLHRQRHGKVAARMVCIVAKFEAQSASDL